MPSHEPDPLVRALQRRSRAFSDDPRALRTRKKLVDAVYRLALTDAPETIAVSVVTAEAQVTRTAFYSHFSDLHDLIDTVIESEFRAVHEADVVFRGDASLSPSESTRAGITMLVDSVMRNPGLYRWGLLRRGSTLRQPLVQSFADSTREMLIRSQILPDGLDPDIVALHAAGGILTVITSYLDGTLIVDESDLAEQLSQLMPPWFSDSRQAE